MKLRAKLGMRIVVCSVLAIACSAKTLSLSRRDAANTPQLDAGTAPGWPSQASTGAGATVAPTGTPAGTFQPSADLNPDAGFDWSESPRGAAACQPGTYTGTFHCDYGPTDANGVHTTWVQVDGPVSFALTRSMQGEFLEISHGELKAVANGFFGFHAMIVGKLDCGTLKLNAMIVDGVWALGDPTMGGLKGGDFTGPLMGALDGITQALTGDWNLDIANAKCPGTWSVSFAP